MRRDWATCSKHQLLALETEHPAAPAAADIFVLIGNVLTPGHEVRQNSTERQTLRQAGGSRRLEDARREQRAAFRDLRRLELVAQALFERRHLAASRISVQISEVAVQRVCHLVDGRRRFGAKQLNERIFGRSPASRGFCRSPKTRSACPAGRQAQPSKCRARKSVRRGAGKGSMC